MIGWCRCRSDIRIFFTMDTTMFEPCRGRSEYKIGGPFDVAAVEIGPASRTAQEQNVLIPDDAAVRKNGPVTPDLQPYSLTRTETGVVAHGNVTHAKIVRRDPETVGSTRVDRIAIGRYLAGMIVIGEDRPLSILPDQRHMVLGGIQLQFLPVGSPFDIDRRIWRTLIQCRLHAAIIPRSVRRYRDPRP